MGSDQSKQKKDDSSPQINDDEKIEQKIQQIEQNVAAEMKADNERLQRLLDSAEHSMKNDDSIPNLIENYAKLRSASKPQLNCISECVDEMDAGWKGIMKQINTIRNYNEFGKKKADTMTAIYDDYWELLLKTKSKIKVLLTQCDIQKDNISELLDIIEEGHKESLSNDDKLAYQDCMNCLGAWIKAEVIESLIDEWKNMSKRLRTEQDGWTTLAKEAGAHAAKKTGWFILKLVGATACIIGVIVIVAAVVVAVVASGGGAAVAVAGAVAGAVAAEAAVSTSVVVVTACAVGAGVLTGSAIYGIKKGLDYKKQAAVIQNDVNVVTKKLENMIINSKKMQVKLTDFKDSQAQIGENIVYLKDDKAYRKMKRALKRLIKCLDNYIEQGKEVENTITTVVNKLIGI